jgi:hypothetical protein
MSERTERDDLSGIEFIDTKERLYFERARLGFQVLDFLRSPVGRYLHGRAKLDLDECKQDALDCNPDSFFGRRKLKKIQRKADAAKSFIRYCTDAITDGQHAEQELEQYRG